MQYLLINKLRDRSAGDRSLWIDGQISIYRTKQQNRSWLDSADDKWTGSSSSSGHRSRQISICASTLTTIFCFVGNSLSFDTFGVLHRVNNINRSAAWTYPCVFLVFTYYIFQSVFVLLFLDIIYRWSNSHRRLTRPATCAMSQAWARH